MFLFFHLILNLATKSIRRLEFIWFIIDWLVSGLFCFVLFCFVLFFFGFYIFNLLSLNNNNRRAAMTISDLKTWLLKIMTMLRLKIKINDRVD